MRDKFTDLLDKINFKHIFIFWIVLVVVFGFFYYYFPSQNSNLYYIQKQQNVNNLLDSIYFSFVAAMTSGFGDIVPFGFFKFVSMIEVFLGLLLLAVITSRLVSLKQDVILTELYDISFNERVNKLRSSLLLFRQNVNNIIHNLQEGNRSERTIINNTDFYLIYLENILNEAGSLVSKNNKGRFLKQLDPVNTEIIFNSMLQSLQKLHELILILDKYKIRWRSNANVETIRKCLLDNENLFERLNNSKITMKPALEDLNSRKEDISKMIIKELE